MIIDIGYNIAHHRMNLRASPTVGQLNTINLISRQDRDCMRRKLYDALKILDETPSNSIKNFDNLILEDSCSIVIAVGVYILLISTTITICTTTTTSTTPCSHTGMVL